MITWYQDDKLKILFDKEPITCTKKILPTMPKDEIEEIRNKPLVLKNRVFCRIIYQGISYGFVIEKGYRWDGATIPSFAWALIGQKLDPEFYIPSMVHDVLCENHDYVNNNRYLSTLVLDGLLCANKVNAFKRWIMKHSVDNFQKTLWK